MFFTYRQNKSHGVFLGNLLVIVEADTSKEANDIAFQDGEVYFDGCRTGEDCDCCGDRWTRCNNDWDNVPSQCGKPLPLTGDGRPGYASCPGGNLSQKTECNYGVLPIKIIYKTGVKCTPDR